MKDRDYDDKKDEPTKRLDQDYDTPFSEPSDARHRLPADYPTKDSQVDKQEAYDVGEDAASTANDPHGERPAGDRPRKAF